MCIYTYLPLKSRLFVHTGIYNNIPTYIEIQLYYYINVINQTYIVYVYLYHSICWYMYNSIKKPCCSSIQNELSRNKEFSYCHLIVCFVFNIVIRIQHICWGGKFWTKIFMNFKFFCLFVHLSFNYSIFTV